jgi:hypothetical protein
LSQGQRYGSPPAVVNFGKGDAAMSLFIIGLFVGIAIGRIRQRPTDWRTKAWA